MEDVITIGKRLVPIEQIAFVEPFDPAVSPDFESEKPFRARVVMLNRDMLLAEVTPQEFAKANGFRMLAEDSLAVNPAIIFQIETFTASDRLAPTKAYASRLKWRDADSYQYSKLLVTAPDVIIAQVMHGKDEPHTSDKSSPISGAVPPGQRTSRKLDLVHG
jgi:hypothetical protein